MGATVYSEFESTGATLSADIRTKILTQTDWAEITPSTTLTTTTASSIVGATSLTISAVSTTAAGMSVGNVIVIDKGTGTEERVTIASRGSTTTVGITGTAAVFAHSSGAVIQQGSYIVKATTTRGAQLVLDLVDGTSTLRSIPIAAYRTHTGAVGGGVDKAGRFLSWKSVVGAATDLVHVVVSVSKEHLFISTEGPRSGEANPDLATTGSQRTVVFLGDLQPYFASDTIPAAVLVAPITTTTINDALCHVSRNQGDTASWVPARLGSIAFPNPGAPVASPVLPATFAAKAAADNNYYFFPLVVVEVADGMRGRIASIYDAGYNVANLSGEPSFTAGQKFTLNSVAYIVAGATRAGSAAPIYQPFGVCLASGGAQSMILVPA